VDVFEIDRADIESGIHEGIKFMSVGDRAKLIIPSHLAHGLVGDLDKVPPLSTLVVDIHLIVLGE
jgi:FKBP-type peptidyl-prolyl cis-trans isomerase